MTRLDGPDSEKLRKLLLPIFTPPQFRMLLSDAFTLDVDNLSLANTKEQIVFDVIAEANRGRWVADLVEAARRVRPREEALYQFAVSRFQLGIRAIETNDEALQRLVVKTSSILNIVQFRTKLAEVERRVARISYDVPGGTVFGTGFLVGPSALITNYHVIKPILDNMAQPAAVKVQFDYKTLDDGKQIGKDRTVALHNDWCIDWSPYATADKQVAPVTLPTAEELDYAVLRLAEPVGKQTVAATNDPEAPERGIIDLAVGTAAPPPAGTSAFIVQHPKGGPLSIAMETQGMLQANGNNTRLRYQTNTEGGSSGSPVFDQHWKLIALHHAGDPDFSELHHAQYNQGVPIHLIVALLKKNPDKYAALSA